MFISETQKARNTIPCQLDIPYGESKFEKIDIFGTDLPANAPSFLWIHGGYWRAGNRSWSGHFVSTLYSWGFRPIVIDYPLAPKCNKLFKKLFSNMLLTIAELNPVYIFTKFECWKCVEGFAMR